MALLMIFEVKAEPLSTSEGLAPVPVLMEHTGWLPGDTCAGRSGISHFSLLEGQCFPPTVHSESSLQPQPVCSHWRREKRMNSVFPIVH